MPCTHTCCCCKVTTTTTTVECVPHDEQTCPRTLDKRTDRLYYNLSEVHYAAENVRLALTFPVGSLWEYGPFTEGRDPVVVRVTGAPYASGVNCSTQPEDRDALNKPCWFIETEVVYSPSGKPRTDKIGYPPHTLCALTPRMALLLTDDPAPLLIVRTLRGRIRLLEADMERLQAELDTERKNHKVDILKGVAQIRKRADAEARLLALQTKIDQAMEASR